MLSKFSGQLITITKILAEEPKAKQCESATHIMF